MDAMGAAYAGTVFSTMDYSSQPITDKRTTFRYQCGRARSSVREARLPSTKADYSTQGDFSVLMPELALCGLGHGFSSLLPMCR